MSYTFRNFYIPDHMMISLLDYIERREPPGGFLTAVISNDLRDAVEMADDINISNIPAYVSYLYNKAPCGCWGSVEKMRGWLRGRIP